MPQHIGSCDASGLGMGGVWFPPDPTQLALLWRTPFPEAIRSALVSAHNPAGSITNSDLKLMGAIAHQDVLATNIPVAETTNALLNDNMAAIHWLRRGSVMSTKAAAYLLRLQALHQRYHRYTTTYDYIPGPTNAMADDCLRLWHLSDAALLTRFHSLYPQAPGWRLCHLSSATNSALTSALWQQRLAPESYLPEPLLPTAIGRSGSASAPASNWTPTSPTAPLTPYTSSAYLPYTTEPENLHPAGDRSSLAQWKTLSAQWARRWPYWGPRILGSTR